MFYKRCVAAAYQQLVRSHAREYETTHQARAYTAVTAEERGKQVKLSQSHLSRRAAAEVVPGDHDGVLGRHRSFLHCFIAK